MVIIRLNPKPQTVSKHFRSMKQVLIILTIMILPIYGFSQKQNCGCEHQVADPKDQYICDTTIFTNGAKMYWQCDNGYSKLIFKNKEKVILKVCEDAIIYVCDRTGLSFLKEYPNYLLFQYRWISGCCTSPDVIFINKENGSELWRIGSDLFVWGDVDENYILYFSDTTCKELIYLNNNTDKKYTFSFAAGQINESIIENDVSLVADLFKNFKKDKNEFTFDFNSSEGIMKKLKIKIK